MNPVHQPIRRIARAVFAGLLALAAAQAAAASAAGSAPPGAHDGHDGHEAHAGHGAAALHLDEGRRWSTDETLRQGMAAIRAAIVARMPAIHDGSLDAAGYAALADAVEAEVGRIIANCRLAPEADAQLHVVLSDIVLGIGRMRAGDSGDERHDGVRRVVRAYHEYGKFFDDPGFQSLKHRH